MTALHRLLTGLAADRLALLQRHEAGARVVSHYDFNNTYQQILAREETHLTWLRDALAADGLSLPSASSEIPVPEVPGSQSGRRATRASSREAASTYTHILEDDARHLRRFVERWRSEVNALTHVRHRTMLNVMLDESVEHQRLFENASAGVEDLLGRRTPATTRTGSVLSKRWVE